MHARRSRVLGVLVTLTLALGALVAIGAGPSAAQSTPDLPVTVENADGTSTTVTDVSKIIPLNGDIAEVVYALGLGDDVVATDVSATYPPEADSTPKVGYQRSLSAEGILSFQPTVVIGNVEAGPPAAIEQIRAAGVPVVILPVERSIDAPAKKIEAVAEALGVPERGDKLAAKTTKAIKKVTKLAKKAEEQPRVVFLYVRGATTQLIGGKGSGADTMIKAARGTDAASEAGLTDFAPITAESLVAAAPEYIIVTTSGLESVGGIDGLLAIPGIAQTPAGQERAILAYDDQELLGGGPRTAAALRKVVLDIHPDLQ